ncbi:MULTISPECIES: phospholipase D-like domain-containing protein [Bacteria]|uniref:phospholipase D-like domain-containing protein n=1 Tax=Bacteria TaxID=2 RepID=UPI0023549EC9|nr:MULTISPECIES: phospholipase D-like domain-containing protein [Bacteria]MCI5763019.1 phospholipase D-like domain-containing protein [Actinobacillus porcinus]MDY5436495.1 phospholipase D-like domain-containing protein [Peptostreptococcus porci]
MSKTVIRAAITPQTYSAKSSDNWFLGNAESKPMNATVQPLVNGERAFGEVYKRIEAAEHSVEIAIWGFQPSMFFVRGAENTSLCIGDLLIQKALNGVSIKVLVWSMSGYAQTFTKDTTNLGKMATWLPILNDGVLGETDEQKSYDYYWYKVVRGDTDIADIPRNGIYTQAYERLYQFAREKAYSKLQYKNRTIVQDTQTTIEYDDKDLPLLTKAVLRASPSHHQKSVLIDYDSPEKAVGFVLEHNMLDNYWDNDEHHSMNMPQTGGNLTARLDVPDVKKPNEGKNVPTPLQDVSVMVTGPILSALNHNFIQSWNRENDNFTLNHYNLFNTEQNKRVDDETNKPFKRKAYEPNLNRQRGKAVKAQILRTYDTPKLQEIKEMYYQNINRTTSYIYTENQYFRFPPLVDKFVEHWQKMKKEGRTQNQPIHWFVVTNSSADGMGNSEITTQQMLQRLGKSEQLPKMMKVFGEVNADDIANAQRQEIERQQQRIQRIQDKRQHPKAHYTTLAEYEQDEARLKADLKVQEERLNEEGRLETEQTYQKFIDEIGIKAHICTLVSMNSPADNWQEVYIHSKVTLINDVFMCISSANLNTRSMQIDTELGIITECREVATNLRRELWGLHTGNDPLANPEDLVLYKNAEKAYETWSNILDKNESLEAKNSNPAFPLRKFSNDVIKIFKWWNFD